MQEPSGSRTGQPHPFLFPRWTNSLRTVVAVVAVIAPVYWVLVVAYGASPRTIDVGYAPAQPVAYSHTMHAGTLGMDCRYCHNTVEDSPHASIPPTQTCMNCHANITIKDSAKLTQVRESYATGMSIEWIRIHDLADFAYFNHSAHVRRGSAAFPVMAAWIGWRWCIRPSG